MAEVLESLAKGNVYLPLRMVIWFRRLGPRKRPFQANFRVAEIGY
jgi:hypothetical protein